MTAVRTQVGFIGTGALGGALAAAALDRRLIASVWNRTPGKAQRLVNRGAAQTSTVSELFDSASVVVITLSTYADVRSVLADALRLDGRTIVNLSSGTPQDAVALAEEVHRRDGRYLDGAAMSGTRLVGDPSATFFYSGDEDAFANSRAVLDAFGKAQWLGANPATSSAYDTAILGMILGFLTASYQALALLDRQGIDSGAFPAVIRAYWPFVVDFFDRHATQLRAGSITPDDGTVDVYRSALGHLIDTNASVGVDTTFGEAISTLLRRTSEAGHGADGLAYLAHTLTDTRDAAVR
jgi:3-hydroxyisobutyrate dehydrogenase-like beta-hydroxyacid dehydrogenase